MNKTDTFQENLEILLNTSKPDLKKRKQLIVKNTIKFMSAANGFYISRMKISEIEHAIKGTNDKKGKSNILKQAVRLMEKSDGKSSKFFKCADNGLSLETALNLLKESVPEEYPYLLIAWKVQSRKTEMVGMATCIRFDMDLIDDENTKTKKILEPYYNDYYYIDVLCVSDEGKGAGRLLVLTAFDIALRKGMKGVIAMSFSADPDMTPPSLKMFTEDLKFNEIVKNSSKNTSRVYVVKNSEESFDLLNKEMLEICTRTNLYDDTKFIWKCEE